MAAPAVVAVLAALTIVIFIVVIAASVLVTLQVHREERQFRRNGRRLTLTRPAPSRWARLARSVCGVYVYSRDHEPLEDVHAREEPPWYERSSGPNWR